MPTINLHDQVIVITGASSGIGAATALACAQAGMHVVVSARRVERLEQVARQVTDAGRRALVVPCDVTVDEDVKRLVAKTVAEFDRLDVMFANAGYGLFAPVERTTDQQYRDIFETNFFGTVRCIKAALPVMRQKGRGHIVICSSAASEIGPPMYGPYAATKAAQDAIACAMRAELHSEGLHVTSVHPIGTRTEFFDRLEREATATTHTNTPDVIKQSADHVAKCIVKALRRPTAEVWPSKLVRYGVAIGTAFPSLAAWGLRKHTDHRNDAVGNGRK
ncbi:MAG: SDR family NAD(P)-dependent oxidoreductase [Phycisphaeraceae bacterium]